MRKRLLIIYSANSAVCGVGTWVSCLSDQLSQRGWDVVVGLSQGNRFHNPANIQAAWPNLNTIVMDGRTGTVTGRRQAVLNTINKVRPDLVLLTLLDDGLRAMQMLKQQGSSIRFAVANHGNAPEHLAAIIELHRELDLVATVNQASYDLLKIWPETNWPDSVLHRIPNAVPLPVVERPSRRGRNLRIGFVGRLSFEKGANQVPSIVRKLESYGVEFQLLVAGDGPESSCIKEMARQQPQNIRYLGPLTRRQLYSEVYPILDVILCCSLSEGWPMAIAEAMIHGAVPVSSAFTGIVAENVIRDSQTGLIFPVADSNSAAICLRRLAQQERLLERLSTAAREEIASNFSINQFAATWDETLQSCRERPPRPFSGNEYPRRIAKISRIKEVVRRMLNLSVPHESVRAEWPTWTPRDVTLAERIRFALNGESSNAV